MTIVHGLASFMASAGSVRVESEIESDFSDVSGPPPPGAQETQSHKPFNNPTNNSADFLEGTFLNNFNCV